MAVWKRRRNGGYKGKVRPVTLIRTEIGEPGEGRGRRSEATRRLHRTTPTGYFLEVPVLPATFFLVFLFLLGSFGRLLPNEPR
jgi:hypothetical protein